MRLSFCAGLNVACDERLLTHPLPVFSMRGSRDVLVTAEAELREVKQYVDELTMG